jgi:hypothetical protein
VNLLRLGGCCCEARARKRWGLARIRRKLHRQRRALRSASSTSAPLRGAYGAAAGCAPPWMVVWSTCNGRRLRALSQFPKCRLCGQARQIRKHYGVRGNLPHAAENNASRRKATPMQTFQAAERQVWM